MPAPVQCNGKTLQIRRAAEPLRKQEQTSHRLTLRGREWQSRCLIVYRVPDRTTQQRRPKGDQHKPAKALEARYANYFQIGHNAFEVLLEFGQQESIHTRIYLSPQHAQILSNLLLDTLQQQKQLFGSVSFLEDKQRNKPH